MKNNTIALSIAAAALGLAGFYYSDKVALLAGILAVGFAILYK